MHVFIQLSMKSVIIHLEIILFIIDIYHFFCLINTFCFIIPAKIAFETYLTQIILFLLEWNNLRNPARLGIFTKVPNMR